MSLELWIILGFSAVGVVLGWRLVTCLQQVTGASLRSQERRERSLTDTIERLVEKERIKASIDLAHVHARERMEAVRASASVESKAVERNNSRPEPGPLMVPPEEASIMANLR